jgi:hypothetical protein
MEQAMLLDRMFQGIAAAIRATSFSASGTLPDVDPEFEVVGLGPLSLPLKPAAAKRLAAVCKQAPYGQGTRTLVDKRVRNSFELSPKEFTLTNPEWDAAIRTAVEAAARELGLPAERVRPQLYKLLLYRTGGFFLPHRDSEKSNRMVGSLVVVLPTPFNGGALTVRHRESVQRFDFKLAAAGQSPEFAAFYADCEHEVACVTDGFRLCLAYNLVLKPAPRQRKSVNFKSQPLPADELAKSLSQWVATSKAEPLVFALDHQYTQLGLSLDLLKGNDRTAAELVVAAAERAGCLAYLCQVSRHVLQFADDGSWGRRWRSSVTVPRHLELGEVYEDDLHGAEWVDVDGKRQKFPVIGFSTASIIASTPLEEWKPTREEYEGYTGNAGNTLDRWYHRSALCVWHRDHHFDVLARNGVEFAIDVLSSMVGKLKKTPKKRLDEARGECIRLARAIMEQWPQVGPTWFAPTDRERPLNKFPALLQEIGDPQVSAEFLRTAASRDALLDLDSLVVATCREHGSAHFAAELTALLEADEDGVRARDISWLVKLAAARFDDPAKDPLVAKLARAAANRFCQPPSPRRCTHEDPARIVSTLAAIVRMLVISRDEESLERVISCVNSDTECYSVKTVQVPCLERIVVWCRKQDLPVPGPVADWLNLLQQELTAATAEVPKPPADWSRPAEIACSCQYCQELNLFLADASAATGRISARDDRRYHLISQINKHQCDVTHKLERKGSPYALVFTKTTGSFERRQKRYAADQKLLSIVNGLLAVHTPARGKDDSARKRKRNPKRPRVR